MLWKKIKPALSAGRVQSVAVRLIVDRENEINNFKSEPYYRVTARFNVPGGSALKAELSKRLPDETAAREFLEACAGATYRVSDINVRPLRKSPAPPFTTSTLQQEASRKLGFTVSQTMMIAQKLYEAGYITYMRTDSLNLSSLAIGTISKLIKSEHGEQYLHIRKFHTSSKGAQEAHEAIRPTYIDKETIEGTDREKKLYRLIRLRTIASQMADAEIEKTTIDIVPGDRKEHFTATGEVIKFDGFLKVYLEGNDDESDTPDGETALPRMSVGETLTAIDVTAAERYTLQPPRYTEASLVKKMEELGIGRPSTYAPTISTIQNREYVEKGEKPGVKREFTTLTLNKEGKIKSSVKSETVGADKGKLIPTDTGIIVNEFLTRHFPDILDYDFTAQMEAKFDLIAEGNTNWANEIGEFYSMFHPEVEKANGMRTEHKVGERQLGVHPESGLPVSVKIGRFGPVVQIGSGDSGDKPHFASLRKDQSVFDITLEDALKLFELPRTVGEYEGKEVIAAVGRFGPYLRHDNKFVSIPKNIAPTAITIEEAISLIDAKRAEEANKVVKTFDEDPDIQILNGRYGIYIACKKSNYKIPKTVADPAALSIEEVRAIIAEQDAKPKKATTRRKKS